MYSLLLAIIYLAFISLGLPDSLIGAGWPAMHQDLGVPVGFAGIVTFIVACGTVVSSLSSDRLTRRFGAPWVTGFSVALTAAALLGFSFSGQFWMLCVWALPYGLGAGAVDAALNNYVALHYAARHMNWLHSFWGVGASISPFIMSGAISSGPGWASAFRTVGLIQLIITVLLLVSVPLWGRVNGSDGAGHASEASPTRQHVPLAKAFSIPGVPALLVAFISYMAVESTTILWASSYLVSERNISTATAASYAALYLLGITAGRFLAGFIADRIGDRWLIRGGFLLVGIGVLLLALPSLPAEAALAGLVIAGLGSAPIYPAIIHSTPTNFGREKSQAIIGIQMAAAYSGTVAMPPLFGALSTWTGLWVFPLFLGLFVLAGLVMSERLNRITPSALGVNPAKWAASGE